MEAKRKVFQCCAVRDAAQKPARKRIRQGHARIAGGEEIGRVTGRIYRPLSGSRPVQAIDRLRYWFVTVRWFLRPVPALGSYRCNLREALMAHKD